MLNFVLKIIHSAVLLLLVSSYLGRFVPPAWFVYPAFLALAFPYLYILNIGATILWVMRPGLFLIPGIVSIFIFFGSFQNFIGTNIDLAPTKANENSNVRIMTYNIRFFLGNKNLWQPEARQKEASHLQTVIKEIKPNILCLQEIFLNKLGQQFVKKVQQDNNLKYLYFNYGNKNKNSKIGNIILSKYPILASGYVNLPKNNGGNGCIWTDLNINKQRVRIYNFHLASFLFEEEVAQSIEKIFEGDENWDKVHFISNKMATAFKIREKQAKAIQNSIQNAKIDNLILAGDMNETPSNYTYRYLSQGLQNCYAEKGFGLGFSYYNTWLPFVIDYIFTSETIQVENSWIIKKTYSDHYPVVADVKLKAE